MPQSTFGPDGGLWRDLPSFQRLRHTLQSVLQTGAPANDVLLYYNIFDVWDKPGRIGRGLIIQNPLPPSLKDTGLALLNRGYGFDYISDHFLAQSKFAAGHLMLAGNPARVHPGASVRLMPLASLEKLINLAREGALFSLCQ